MNKLWFGVVAVIMLSFSSSTFAQCDCDFIISLSESEWQFDGAKKGVKPGDKICFTSGTRTGISMMNINGTAANPVIITNMCDGKVILNAPSNWGNAVEFNKSSHFRFTGSGNSGVEHGIEIRGAQMGLNITGLSTDFEVDHVNVNNVGCVGIVAKTDPTCDQATWRGNFTLRNTSFHDNIVQNTGCEGFYIGNSHYETTVSKSCNGSNLALKEHDVVNVKVFNNKVQNTANDGIQVGGAISGGEIHHNTVTNFGTAKHQGHMNGFQAGSGTTQAKVYNNFIDTGNGYCYWDQGGGSTYTNNVAIKGLLGGFSLQDVQGTHASTGFVVANNTIIDCKELGVIMYSENPNVTRIVNNIIYSSLSNYQFVKFNSSKAQSLTIETNNLKASSLTNIKFANFNGKDYHLLAGSAAIDAGTDMKSYGVVKDMDEKPRPAGNAFDIGAYEFQSSTSKAPPVVSAGADKTITLPTNSTSFTGSASVSGGTISKYAWTKVSGGAATLTNANAATLNVSGVVAGTYTFRLTATDNSGAVASDDVKLTVNTSVKPVVNAGADKTITLPTNSTSFTGSASVSGGTISKYAWTKVSGGTATLTNAGTSTLSVSKVVAGSYTFRLTATDNKGVTSYDDVALVVKSSSTNKKPSANSGGNKTVSLPTSSITLTGTGQDTDGTISKYTWKKLSGKRVTLSSTNSNKLTISGLVAGTYRFRFSVTDNAGATAYNDMVLTVNASTAKAPAPSTANVKPIANAGGDKTITLPTNSISLNGSGQDSDGTIASYEWKKLSGSRITLGATNKSTLSLNGLVEGSYKFRLVVTDNAGATGYNDVMVTVKRSSSAQARSAGTDESEIDILDITQNTIAEEEFVFLGKNYDAGYEYIIVIYNKDGKSLFHGKWSDEVYQQIVQPGEMYIYHVFQNGKKVDVGKFVRSLY